VSDVSPSFEKFIAPVIASAYAVLRAGRLGGDAKGSVVALIVAARIIERDMLASLAPGPTDELMELLEQQVRLEIEKIYTRGWARQ
jgi:hypothetical protein